MKNIAFIGKICSGKTTITNNLIIKLNENNFNYKKASFADGVYEIAYNLFDMKNKNRNLLQSIGMKMREIDENIWIKSTIKKVNHFNKNDTYIIIDDCRFQNELDNLIKNDFILIKLNISNELQLNRLKNTYPDTWNEQNLNHISENNLNNLSENIFQIIINIDDFKNLNDIIDNIYNKILYFI